MKIGTDISQIVYGTGVSWYTWFLLENLLEIDKRNEYVLFGGSWRRIGYLKSKTRDLLLRKNLKGNLESRIWPISPSMASLIWNKWHIFPIENLIGKIDVFHSSDWTQPPTKAFKVTTVHDLAPLKFPELTHPKVIDAHKLRLKWVKKEVDLIIVPSASTKKDLTDLAFSGKKIRVIPEAAHPIFKPRSQKDIEKIKLKYGIKGKYLLAIGGSPRKNIAKVVEAYKKIKADKDLELVVIGRQEIKMEVSPGIKFIGHIEFDELPYFYSGAEALIYPSLYEGFGLPILEAFCCGCPVATSNISSMPEVAGDGAVMVDPYSVNSIIDGIKKALRNREDLVRKGFAQALEFSWEKTARETLKVYLEAVM